VRYTGIGSRPYLSLRITNQRQFPRRPPTPLDPVISLVNTRSSDLRRVSMVPVNLTLPIISFTSPTVADQLRSACLEHGFFQLVDHPIPQSLQDRTLSAMQSFFSLPTDIKMSLKRTDDTAGYEAMQSQKLEKGTIPDIKEGFYCGREGHVFTGTKFVPSGAEARISLCS